MRNLKRIALIAIVLIISATLNVYAGATQVNLTASATEVKVGDTVTITLSAKSGTGIEGINSTLEYDKTKLKLTNEEQLAASGFTSASGTDALTGKFKLSLMYTGTDKAPQEADCAKLTFEVLSGAKAGESLNIKVSEIELGGSNDDWTEDLPDKTVTLKVKEEATKPDDNNPSGGDKPSGEDKPSEENKPGDYPYAGVEDSLYILAIGGIILSVIFYAKSKNYRDIK